MTETHPDGYLAVPPTEQGTGVLVLHAWWGLNDTIRAFCDRLASAGFVAFVPDLYHGRIADTIAGAEALSDPVFANQAQARADIAEAAACLEERTGSTGRGLAVVGFSLGAYFALDLSVSAPEQIRSVVVYYGSRPGDYGNAQAAYLGHYAEKDVYESQSDVDNLEQSLRRAGRPVTFYRYEGTGHWFAEPDRSDAYDEEAAELAWERTLTFLKCRAAL